MQKIYFTLLMFLCAGIIKAQTLFLHTSQTNVRCYGDSTGNAKVSTAADTADTYYYYQWSNGSTFQTLGYVPAGTYTVTVTGGITSVTASASVTITQPASAVSVTASATGASTCTGYDGTLSATASGGTPGYTYPWNNGQQGANLSGLHSGIYTVTATDANGCTATVTATVGSPASFSISFSTVPPTCYGGMDGAASVSVNGDSSASFYIWSNNEATDTITDLAAGVYTVTVTNARGCEVAGSVTVSQPPAINISISSTPSACSQSTGALSAGATGGAGGFSYMWSGGATTSQINSLAAGLYNLTVTSAGCTATAVGTVNNSNGPKISVVAFNPSCFNGNDGAIFATVSGGTPPYSYLWIPGGGTTANISGLIADGYTVLVTDHQQCTGKNEAILAQPTYVEATPFVYNVSCNGLQTGSITLASTGGAPPYTYMWNNGDTTPFAANLIAGTYDYTVTDAHGCQTSSSEGVLQPEVLNVSFDTVGSSGGNGTATAIVSGGNYPYTFSWSNFETSQTDTALSPGSYSVTVIDSKGCSVTGTTTVQMVSGIKQTGTELLQVEVYPNPAQNNIYITAQQDLTPATICLADINGQIVYNANQPLLAQTRYAIDVSTLAPGIYLLKVAGGEKELLGKVVVEK